MNKKSFDAKNCLRCGFELTVINFSSVMTEQWAWNGDSWECTAHHSLIYDSAQEVRCPECDNVVGTGKDFGF